MRGMIYAVSPEGVIGVGGAIPWHHAGDLKRFKRTTMGSTVVMGRTTFESIGKALPGRQNIVVTTDHWTSSASSTSGASRRLSRAQTKTMFGSSAGPASTGTQ